jgi:serine O-acetyltransferase
LINFLRIYQRLNESLSLLASICKRFAVLAYRFWSAVAGADIPLNSKIGGGLVLPHPKGIVIHPNSAIGPNCLIFQQVTIGTRCPGAVAVIGGHVDIGAGAKVLGPISLGTM